MRLTVRAKTVFLIVAIVILCCVTIGTTAFKKSNKAMEKATNKILSELSIKVAKDIEDINNAEFALLHALAELPEIKSEDISIVDKCQMFRNIINKNPNKYENIAFYDTEGNTSLPNGKPLQLKGKPYIEGPVKTGKDYIQDPAFSTVNNAVIMFMSVPVYNNSGKAIGALVSVIKGNVLNDIAKSIEITPGFHPYIVNIKTQSIIATGTDVDASDIDASVLLKDEQFSKIIERISRSEKGIEVYNDPFNGTKKIAGFKPVEGYDWAVFCPSPYLAFFGDVKKLNRSMNYIIFINMVIGVIVSVLAIGVILKPLKRVQVSISEIATGNADLTRRIPNTYNDEIGDVVNGFNHFADKLQSIVSELKKLKVALTNDGDNLSSSTVETQESIQLIINNIESVYDLITASGTNVSETATAVNQIASNIESLEKMIEKQSQGVESASTAVEQMIGNISSVNNNVDTMAQSFGELYEKTIEGSKLQISVNEKIEMIKLQSETLQEANKVIATIASQTNLLAMNAAIEAAHAGEAGKGFSVVADEIRKLSMTSTNQSNTIGNQLDKIRNSISEVVSASIQTSDAFNTVTNKIQETDTLVQQIKSAINEQNIGSMQISETLHVMNDSTAEVTSASKEMAEGNKSILVKIKNLQEVTSEIGSSMDEMRVGIKKINETGSALNEISNHIGGSISEIGKQIDMFQI